VETLATLNIVQRSIKASILFRLSSRMPTCLSQPAGSQSDRLDRRGPPLGAPDFRHRGTVGEEFSFNFRDATLADTLERMDWFAREVMALAGSNVESRDDAAELARFVGSPRRLELLASRPRMGLTVRPCVQRQHITS
jgi:hypothetical protein